jgi:hypothetical protein
MRAAAQGRKPAFDQPLSGRTIAVRALGASAVLGLVSFALVPASAEARGWLTDGADYLLHGKPRPVEGLDAHTEPPPTTGEDTAPHAVDRRSTPAWSVRWPAETTAVPARCRGSVAPTLVVTLAKRTSIDQVEITPGLDRSDAEWSKEQLPHRVDLLFSDNTCRRIKLAQTKGPQTFDVSADDVTDVRLTVVDTYPPQTGPGGTVSIAELKLLSR